MLKLRYGYIFSGFITGFCLLLIFFASLPDGKLHLVFCNVGQGDSAYVRFPDGRDMLIDAGPGNKVLSCLGREMPFWDRALDLVVISHPQKDHYGGLREIFNRYQVGALVSSGIPSESEDYKEIMRLAVGQGSQSRHVDRGDTIIVGDIRLVILWPTASLAASMGRTGNGQNRNVAGAVSDRDPNDGSLVIHLSYGDFDALFPGDADTRVEGEYRNSDWGADPVEILKVPHHGSRTAITEEFLQRLHPSLAIIPVGKNSYGHPAPELLELFSQNAIKAMRTDQDGDIKIVSDGKGWRVEKRM
jgi:competence protein ComEC